MVKIDCLPLMAIRVAGYTSLTGVATTLLYALSQATVLIFMGLVIAVLGVLSHVILLISLILTICVEDKPATQFVLDIYILLLNIPLFLLCYEIL